MQQDTSTQNLTLSFIDLSIHKSIDFITTTTRQLFQLIFCLVSIVVVSRLINYFVQKPPSVENKAEDLKPEGDAEKEEEVCKEEIVKETSGWESEPIQESSEPVIEVPSSNLTAKRIKKQLKRKCMSVGPIMLTPNSQIVRTLDVEEREERYRYDILPVDASTHQTTTADNVCVPCGLFSFFLN